MPKLQPISDADVAKLAEAALDLSQDARLYANRIEQGYVTDITGPIQKAATLLAASRSLADLAAGILTKAQLQEQKAEIEASLRKRK